MPSLSDRIIKDIKALTISEGRHTGKKFKVLDWQKTFVEGVASHSVSALSMARGNGKTTMLAALACSALLPGGALYHPRSEIVLVASSLKQAMIAFRHILFFVREKMEADHDEVRPGRSPWRLNHHVHIAEIEFRPSGTLLKAIGSDPRRAHGLSPSLVIADEPAQWITGGRRMYNAIDTARGKQVDSKLIAIGTRPENQEHWFSEMIDSEDEDVFVQVYAAERGEDEDFADESIRKANPSYDHMPDLAKVIKSDAKRASQGGPELSKFRALRLNMGTPEITDKEMLVEIHDWEAIETNSLPEKKGPVAIGVDLGDGTSMSAISFYWAEVGILEAYGCFPAYPRLDERGKIDYVGDRYVRMARRGELLIYPGKATNNSKFIKDMMLKVQGFEILGMSADRIKMLTLQQALFEAGIDIEVDFRAVGQGLDGTYDITAFKSEVADGHMKLHPSLALTSAISEAIVTRNHNGNAALNKSRHKGRIDVLQASIIAAGIGRRWRIPSEGDNGFDVNDYVLTEMSEV